MIPVCYAILIVAILSEQSAFARAHDAGVVKQEMVAFQPANSPDPFGLVWSKTFSHQDSSFVQIHFSGIINSQDVPYQITLRDYQYRVVQTYNRQNFADAFNLWSPVINGDTVVVQVEAATEPLGLGFVIDKFAYERVGGEILSITLPNDIEKSYAYKDNAAIRKASRTIARLLFARDSKMWFCSGFLIGKNSLMTNEHCINDEDTCKSSTIWMGYEEVSKGIFNQDYETTRCTAIKAVSPKLDYSIILLDKDVGERWGYLEMRNAEVNMEEELYLIQHPGGQVKQVSKKGCLVTTHLASGLTEENTDFGHACDTMSGSSGSPLINSRYELVGLHHLGMCLSGRWRNENRAVRISAIMQDIASPTPSSGNPTLQDCIEPATSQ